MPLLHWILGLCLLSQPSRHPHLAEWIAETSESLIQEVFDKGDGHNFSFAHLSLTGAAWILVISFGVTVLKDTRRETKPSIKKRRHREAI